MSTTLGDIVDALGGELRGDPSTAVRRIASLANAGEGEISFVAQARYVSQASQSAASALIVNEGLASQLDASKVLVVTDDPYLYYARLSQWWRARQRSGVSAGVSERASIHPTARLGQAVSIGDFAVVGEGAEIGDGAVIGAGCVLEAGAIVGAGSRLSPRVTVGQACQIGARCIVHSGVVIGADGFGFAPHKGQWVKIEQLGAVRIGNDVEIGANTCIDRGALDDTVIEDGVKLDNLIQIGHNVRVGAHSAMAGCVGVAGSADIGRHCTVGGGAIVLGHLNLADGVNISAASVVTRSVREPGLYTGMFPLDTNAAWEKNAVSLRQLSRLRERIRALEQNIKQLDKNDSPD
ncbi:UDP-3-O-(3-hydroxymyristoyl)glucosamine N-acyltransferase [Hydrogenophaga sp. 5NK40-0174]|uniref:UDP-3-O-(3-hydroxymyristoyl)glucosamine N-acyltransferase n=1 Tax=Hydrogenophaga sp. 5NK40-0174 TaxID=3127649 RepID=UPI0031026932